jgi:predicted kinase
LVVLVGPAGAGKTTLARATFLPTEVLSSDVFRGMVSDDEGDRAATSDAFAVLQSIAVRRLRRGRLTVIDATNVRRQDRRALIRMAARFGRPAVAVLFDTPLEVCLARNRMRPERQAEDDVVREQWAQMPPSPSALREEGFVVVLRPAELP